jgi:hypothetical protein
MFKKPNIMFHSYANYSSQVVIIMIMTVMGHKCKVALLRGELSWMEEKREAIGG